MTVFGKVEIKDENLKWLVILGIVLLAGLLMFFVIKPKIDEYQEKILTLEGEQETLKKKYADKAAEEVLLASMQARYEEQKANLEILKQRFRDASLKDETDLKIVIQKLIYKLGLKSSEVSRTEFDTSKKAYEKVAIPFTLTGDFSKIGRFFYYLENSKWLLTFNGSDLRMSKISDKGKEVIQVQFKVGAYILKGGELDFE